MNKLTKSQVGFTLMEMLVVVLIVGILAAVAIPYYGKVLERMRVAEVTVLMGTELSAQERQFLKAHKYTEKWHKLDVQPAQIRVPSADNPFANGEENTIFYTRGKNSNGTPRSGFAVYFEERAPNQWFMTADRVGSNEYSYSITRPFQEKRSYCVPQTGNQKSEVLCTDFMGVEDLTSLPADPRP